MEAPDEALAEAAKRCELRDYGKLCEQLAVDAAAATDKWRGNAAAVTPPTYLRITEAQSDQCPLDALCRSGNDPMDKTVAVLVAVCVEAEQLVHEAHHTHLPALLLFGQCDHTQAPSAQWRWPGTAVASADNIFASLGPVDDEGGAGNAASTAHCDWLAQLHSARVWLARCQATVHNALGQLTALAHAAGSEPHDVPWQIPKGVKSPAVADAMGKLLGVAVHVDEIVGQQACLRLAWDTLRRSIRSIGNNAAKFDANAEEMKALDEVLDKIESQLLSGRAFQDCARQCRASVRTASKANVAHMLFAPVQRSLAAWDATPEEELPSKSKLLNMVALYAFTSQVLDANDKKTLKALWDSYKKLATFHLYGTIMFTPCAFLWHNCSNVSRVIDPKLYQAMLVMRENTVKNLSSMLSKESCIAVLRISNWRLAMDSQLKQWKDAEIDWQLQQRAVVLLRGLQNARSISRCVRALLYCGVSNERDAAIFIVTTRMLDLLKEVEKIYEQHWHSISETLSHLKQMYAGRVLALVVKAKANLAAAGNLSESRVDTLSALVLAERALAAPLTDQRMCLLNAALGCVDCVKVLKSENAALLEEHRSRLSALHNFERSLVAATDCSFLLPHVDKFCAAYFDATLDGRAPSPQCRRLLHLTSALNDCSSFVALAGKDDASKLFDAHVARMFTEDLIVRLCEHVETDLRLCVHRDLLAQPENALLSPPDGPSVEMIACLLTMQPFVIGSKRINVSGAVRQHLETDFYKLSTVAPHDWRSYCRMRQLALDKYSLRLDDPHLPGLALGDELDVLEIMRKIHIFTESYNYDLNMQCFVEKSSGRDKRRLYTLSVSQAADSIRCHGFGIMNTTVNYTYKFLRQKFYIFSQFLYDDQIRSHLVRDGAYFRDNCEELNNLYPVPRAEKFNQAIRKLGMTPDGLTFVDQFRMLVTQIGNAMGYVRLVRAGAAAAASDANQYFAMDLDDLPDWGELLAADGAQPALWGDHVLHAAALLHRLQKVVAGDNMGQQHYFQALVEVFASELRNYDKYAHLRYFYVIVPPLILNAVDHLLSCKQRIGKRASNAGGEAAFSDDGFAMGVAYMLKVLDQNECFDSLHWFESVRDKCDKEKGVIKSGMGDRGKGGAGRDDNYINTMSLKLKRMQTYLKEVDSVAWALQSARIFFRSDTDRPTVSAAAPVADKSPSGATSPTPDNASTNS